MQTNKTIQRGDALYRLGQELNDAAYNYWQEYQRTLGSAAVVWLDDDSGHFVLFTRGEYKAAIMAAANRECATEPVMVDPFDPPAITYWGGLAEDKEVAE